MFQHKCKGTLLAMAAGAMIVAYTTPAMAQSYDGQKIYSQTDNDQNNIWQSDFTNSTETSHDSTPHHDSRDGLYLSVSAGAVFPTDSSVQAISDLGVGNSIGLDVGPNFNIAAGGYIGDFRVEGEIGTRSSAIDSFSLDGIGSTHDVGGHISAFSFMANGYYDIKLSPTIALYIGAGLGPARERESAQFQPVSLGGVTLVPESGTDWVLAYQLMAGVSFKVTDNMHLNVGYRYWSSTDPTFGSGWARSDYEAPGFSEIEVGLRFDL